MRIILLVMLTTLTTLAGFAAQSRLKHVHPLHWWAGMQTSQVQVMLHGEGIGDCEVRLTQADGIKVVLTERVANPNYLFVYLETQDAAPQTFGISLTKPGKKKPLLTQPYELKRRSGHMPDPFGPQDVLYLLMPDRWINANPALDSVPGLMEPAVNLKARHDVGRHGGDLAGIAMGLDYLADLGVTALWPTPVQVNDGPVSYHGYAITDYYSIDPRLGSNEEYRLLVDNCHRHGIKMVMDLVFNHCGANNFLFRDLPQEDWFNFGSQYVQSNYRTNSVGDPHASAYDRKHTTDGWFVENMPDLNQRNPLVKDYLIQCSLWWIEYAGIDGIRQDTYPYADREMMAEWNLALEREYPGFNVVGETWINHAPGVAYWQKDSKLSPFNSQLKTVMDFPLMSLLNNVLDEESDDWGRGLARIYEYISGDMVYADPNYLLTFLGNHDTDRFANSPEKARRPERYEQALLLLLTLRGIPQLYYGDEIGEWGTKAKGDGMLRQNFPVQALDSAGRTALQQRYHAYTRRLLQWRKQTPAVQTGQLTHFALQHGCYVYSRSLGDQRVTVILNGTDSTVRLPLAPYAEVLPKPQTHEILRNQTIRLGQKLTLKPRQSVVLQF